MPLVSVLSIYLLSDWLKNKKTLALFGAGIFMSAATLVLQYYVVGIVFLVAAILYSFYSEFKVKKNRFMVLQ